MKGIRVCLCGLKDGVKSKESELWLIGVKTYNQPPVNSNQRFDWRASHHNSFILPFTSSIIHFIHNWLSFGGRPSRSLIPFHCRVWFIQLISLISFLNSLTFHFINSLTNQFSCLLFVNSFRFFKNWKRRRVLCGWACLLFRLVALGSAQP